MRMYIESAGGRRFLLTVGCGIVNTALVWYGKITPDVYQWITLGTVAAYITGNTAQKIKGPPQ
jgi:hypothetical protein